MRFKDVKIHVLRCMASGNILHAARNDIDIKNLLETGQISVEEVSDIIKRTRGNEYECSPHHIIAEIDVHIIKTRYQGNNWYIKWYFVEPNSVFISVHN
jgi:hypothetical protein